MVTQRRPQEQESDWDTRSGLVDDIDIWIKKSRFGFLDSYQNGEATLLIWDVESPDADMEYPIIWPLGTGWKVTERGNKVSHDKFIKFVNTSMMGRLINRVHELNGVDMRKRGSARDATIWEGLGFHIKRETIEMPPGAAERGLPASIDHYMPTDYLGDNKTPQASPPASSTSSPRRARAASPETGDLETRLATLAASASDIKAFQRLAMNLPALQESENSGILAAVLDDSDNGFYAKSRAEEK